MSSLVFRQKRPYLVPFPPQRDLLLFKIPAVLRVHQHQIQIIPHRKLLVDVPHRRGQIVTGQKHPYRDALAPDRRTVHDLVLGDVFVLGEHIRTGACRLLFDYGNLHVFYLYPDEQEVDLADDDVL